MLQNRGSIGECHGLSTIETATYRRDLVAGREWSNLFYSQNQPCLIGLSQESAKRKANQGLISSLDVTRMVPVTYIVGVTSPSDHDQGLEGSVLDMPSIRTWCIATLPM